MDIQRYLTIAKYLVERGQNNAPNYRPAQTEARCANCSHICAGYDERQPMQELRAFIERAGARHSMTDNQMLQQVHDLAVKLGARCGDE